MTQPAITELAWSPPQGTPEHSGAVIPADAFFAEPPPDWIGALASAESTLSKTKKPRTLTFRTVLSLSVGLACFVVAGECAGLMMEKEFQLVPGALLGGLAGLITFVATASRQECSYVGQGGAIRFTLRQGKPVKAEQIAFEDAAELRTSSTNHFRNGIYTGTDYNFTWTNQDGKKVLVLKGAHHAKDKPAKRLHPFHFARAAEMLWSNFFLERAAAELAETGAITFRMSTSKIIRLSPRLIEFHWGGKIEPLEAQQIAGIHLSQGSFTIKSKDARWFSSKGKFSFEYSAMPNARVFLLALERFLPDVSKSY